MITEWNTNYFIDININFLYFLQIYFNEKVLKLNGKCDYVDPYISIYYDKHSKLQLYFYD